MTARVHIDGMVFEGQGADGGSQSRRIFTDLQGWFSPPPVRTQVDERPNKDGAFGVVKHHRSARAITFEGALVADSFQQAEVEFWDEFAAIQSDGGMFPFSVETDNGIRTCMVTVSGTPEVLPVRGAREKAKVVAQFIAYDPVKYGPDRAAVIGLPTAGGGLEYPLHAPSGALFYGALGNLGRVTLTNAGTAEVWPRFEVTGELADGFFIQCLETGQVLRYERVVPAGTSVSLDSRTGEVLVDGVSDGSTYLTRDEWFPVPRKGSCTVQFNAIGSSSGAPEMTATVADGYW